VTDDQIEELVLLLQPLAHDAPPTPRLPQTYAFNLSGTKVGDHSLEAISTLPIAWLNLNGTEITDAGLWQLRNQQQLSIVTVSGTKVTSPGIDALRKSLHQVWIPVSDRDLRRRGD
jgi:hypothetical protein